MKKTILFLLLLLTVLFSACSQSQELSEEEKRAQELEFLKEQTQKALEEKEKERESRDFTTSSPSTDPNEEFNEEEFTEAPEAEESTQDPEDSNEEERSSSNVDIDLVSVDLNFPSNFDIEDDTVDVEVRIETNGIAQGEGFLVEALASNTDGDEIICQFIYQVGGNEDECELDNFPKLGEYTIDVIADVRDRYKEENEKNNVFLDEFRLEED